jgi:hypothetical protein
MIVPANVQDWNARLRGTWGPIKYSCHNAYSHRKANLLIPTYLIGLWLANPAGTVIFLLGIPFIITVVW